MGGSEAKPVIVETALATLFAVFSSASCGAALKNMKNSRAPDSLTKLTWLPDWEAEEYLSM